MKKLLLLMLLASQMSFAQALVGESSRIIITYLKINKISYYAVSDDKNNPMFISSHSNKDMVIYYFKKGICTECSVVKHGVDPSHERRLLDYNYPKCGNHWCDDAQNAYISLNATDTTVFINTILD